VRSRFGYGAIYSRNPVISINGEMTESIVTDKGVVVTEENRFGTNLKRWGVS
jgi:hypothetical protein